MAVKATREYLATVVEEGMNDWLAFRGKQHDGDPYAGYYHDGHHVVITNYGGFIRLMVDGEQWTIEITKQRTRMAR